MESQRIKAIRAENSLATLQTEWQNYEVLKIEAGLLEEEPEETHWDKGTQTEDEMLEQCLPLKKRPIQIEEESP